MIFRTPAILPELGRLPILRMLPIPAATLECLRAVVVVSVPVSTPDEPVHIPAQKDTK